MAPWLQDFRYAGRLLVRNPGFTLLSVMSLALGIAANTTIFSVISGVLLAPLPYREPDRLMAIYSQVPGVDKFPVSAPEYLEFRRWTSTFQDVGAYRLGSLNISGSEQPLRARAARVSASLMSLLGVDPALGRLFSEEEDLPHAEKVLILGYGFWLRAFGGDPSVLGKRVVVDGEPRTILGVMPPSFDLGGQRIEVWIPLALDPSAPGERENHTYFMVGRLTPGKTIATAREELGGLMARWKREIPESHTLDPEVHRLQIKPLLEDLVGGVRLRILLLAYAAGFVLLVACLNVANLFLVRAEERRMEIAVRTALGADRGRLLRQLLTESTCLSLLSGALGLLLAFWGVKAVVALNSASIPRVETLGIDGQSVAFTLGLSLLTGLLFGLAPAFYSRNLAVLREGGRGTPDPAAQWFRRSLIVVEVTLASALVICAGLLLKSSWLLQRVETGFDPKNLLTMRISLPNATYPDDPKVTMFWSGLTAQLAALPGIEGAAAMFGLPPKRPINNNAVMFERLQEASDGPPHSVDYWQFITRDYFRTIRVQVIEGRVFDTTDTAASPGVVVINQAMAKRFWPHRSPVGERLRTSVVNAPWLTVIGVVADIKQNGLDQEAGTELYFLQEQAPRIVGGAIRTMNLVVRTRRDAIALAGALRSEIRNIDPSLPVSDIQTMEKILLDATAGPRLLAAVVLLFAAVALMLASIGTYGVLSYTVEQQKRAIGIRMALGAQTGEVLQMILKQGCLLAGLGLLLGMLGALTLRRFLSSVLFGIEPTDPSVFGLVLSFLALVSFIACWWPARRAARIDPILAIRQE